MDDKYPSTKYTAEEISYLGQLDEEIASWEKNLTAIPSDSPVISSDITRGLSNEEIKFLLLRPCKDKKQFRNWIKVFLNVDLPDTTIDPDSNSNPLEMVWKLYETAVFYDKIIPEERHLKSLFYCLDGESLIMTREGLVSLKELAGNDKEILSDINLDVWTNSGFQKADTIFRNGIRPMVRVNMSRGYSMEGTPSHPIYIQRDGQIQKSQLGRLLEKDVIPIELGMNIYGDQKDISYDSIKNESKSARDITYPTEITKDLAFVMGLVTSDGCTSTKGYIQFTNEDLRLAKIFKDTIFNLFGNNIEISHKEGDIRYCVCSTNVERFFNIGLGYNWKLGENKDIPLIIRRASKDIQLKYLGGLYSGDGFLHKNGSLRYATTSTVLARQLQSLLLNMGYFPLLNIRQNTYNKRRTFDVTDVCLDYKESADLLSKIDFYKVRYDSKNRIRSTSVTERDTITYPIDQSEHHYFQKYLNILSENKILAKHHTYLNNAIFHKSISRQHIEKMLSQVWFPESDRQYWLNKQKYRYVKVKDVEYLGKREVFDIQVPIGHRFWSEGIDSGNCSRGSFKTLCACITELAIMMHSGRNTVHIGLIESQAKTAYNMYLRPFLEKPYIKDWVKVNSILERSEIKDNKDKITTIQVIPLTMNKTSSPRANLVVRDEIDKTKGEQVQAYENAAGMLTATNDKKLPMEFDISSRDSAHGMVQEVIDNAPNTGTKVYHWNRIDITERCPDARSGNVPVRAFIKKDTLITISESEYDELDSETQKDYEMNWALEGCLKRCSIFAACKGYLKNQRSKCKWLKTIEDTQNAILSAPSEEMAISQLLCRTPPKKGLVYSDFDPKKNMMTPNQMYQIWAKKVHINPKLTTEDLITIFQKAGLACYVGVDPGFHHPAALLVFIDDSENVYVMKEHMPEEVDSEELAQWLGDNWKKYKPTRVYVDPESPDCTRFVRKKGFVVSDKVDKARQLGISTMKGFIRRPATQITQLFVNIDCFGLKYEFSRYAYKQNTDGTPSNEAKKEHDHALDALRYIIHSLFGRSRGNVAYQRGFAKEKSKQTEREETYQKTVRDRLTPQAVAAILGQNVIDNRNILEAIGEDLPQRKSTTGFDPNDF